MVPAPEVVKGLAVLVSEWQDLGHGLSEKKTGCAPDPSRDEERLLTPRGASALLVPAWRRRCYLAQAFLGVRASQLREVPPKS